MLGLAAIYIFAVWLHLLPSGGIQTLGKPSTVPDFLVHLILPAFVLGLSSAAPLMRYTRASMLDVLEQRVRRRRRSRRAWRTARSSCRHAFRNSLIPIITVIGLLLPELVAGAVITEQIFAWPGMGQLAVRAASDRDTGADDGRRARRRSGGLVTNILVDVLYASGRPEDPAWPRS